MSDRFDLRAARLNAGLSLRGLARETGVHEVSVKALEEGGTVHPATAKKIADHFSVKVTDVMPLDREAA